MLYFLVLSSFPKQDKLQWNNYLPPILLRFFQFLFSTPGNPEVNSHCLSFLSRFLKQAPSVTVLTLSTSHSRFGLWHLDHSSTTVRSISEMLQIRVFISLFPLLPQSASASEESSLPSSASLPNPWLQSSLIGSSLHSLAQLRSHNHLGQARKIVHISHCLCAFMVPLFSLAKAKPNALLCALSIGSATLYYSLVILLIPSSRGYALLKTQQLKWFQPYIYVVCSFLVFCFSCSCADFTLWEKVPHTSSKAVLRHLLGRSDRNTDTLDQKFPLKFFKPEFSLINDIEFCF